MPRSSESRRLQDSRRCLTGHPDRSCDLGTLGYRPSHSFVAQHFVWTPEHAKMPQIFSKCEPYVPGSRAALNFNLSPNLLVTAQLRRHLA